MAAATIVIGNTVGDDYKRSNYASDFACWQAALDHFNNHDFTNDGALSYIKVRREGSGTDGLWDLGQNILEAPTGCTGMSAGAHLVIKPHEDEGGHSFGDDDALAFNAAFGVAITAAPYYDTLCKDWPDYTEIEDIQFRSTSSTGTTCQPYASTSGLNSYLKFRRCIFTQTQSANTNVSFQASSKQGPFFDRCLIYGGKVQFGTDNVRLVGNTVYAESANTHPMVGGQWSATFTECSGNIFFETGGQSVAHTSNTYTHGINNGSNDTTDTDWAGLVDQLVTSGNGTKDCFVTAGSDFRLKDTATAVTEAGTTVSGFSSTDIRGITIPDPPALGAWQFSGTAADTEAPTVPTNLAVDSRTRSSITWDWSASTDNVGVTGYEVSEDNGTAIDKGNTLTHTKSGLADGTSVNLKVRAYDAAGNRSAYTSNVQGTSYVGKWVLPANATPSTAARLIVMATGASPATVAQEGSVTADANGDFKLTDTTNAALDTQRLAIVHAYGGVPANSFNAAVGVATLTGE